MMTFATTVSVAILVGFVSYIVAGVVKLANLK